MEVLLSAFFRMDRVSGLSLKRIGSRFFLVWVSCVCSLLPSGTVAQLVPKIVGGQETKSEWPWMVALIQSHFKVPANGAFCGGSLVHPQWVLTAAHCVEEQVGFGFVAPDSLHVVIGSHDLSIPDQGVRIPVLEIIVHPDYNGDVSGTGNDVALLLLAWPVEEAQPITLLDDPEWPLENTMATSIGWGVTSTEPNAKKPSKLREATYPIVSNTRANEPRAYDGMLTSSMLPAGYPKGRVSSCYGDSGGPLMIQDPTTGEWLQVGIVSFGSDCATPFSYGIYTRLTSFSTWIVQHIHPAFSDWMDRNKVVGSSGDADLDGWNHFEEFAFGSDPHNKDSIPGLTAQWVTLPDTSVGGFRLNMKAPFPGRSVDYRLLESDDLTSWQTVNPISVQALTSGGNSDTFDLSFSLGIDEKVQAARFYQVLPEFAQAAQPFVLDLSLGYSVDGTMCDVFREPDPANPLLVGSMSRHYRLKSESDRARFRLRVSSEDFLPGLDVYHPITHQLLLTHHPTDPLQDVVLAVDDMEVNDLLISVVSQDGREGEFELVSWRMPNERIKPGEKVLAVLVESAPLTSNPYGDHLQTDSYLLSNVEPGQALEIHARSVPIDMALIILDAETGRIVAEDDDSGEGLDAALVLEPAREGQEWIIQVTTSGWHDLGQYELEVLPHVGEPLDHTPLSGTLRPGDRVEGVIDASDARFLDEFGEILIADIYDLTGVEGGQLLTIELISDDLDAYLQLVDAFTSQLIEYNDDHGLTSNARIDYPVPPGGLEEPARIVVSGFDRVDHGAYELWLEQSDVPTPLTAPSTRMAIGEVLEGTLDLGDHTYFDAYTGVQPADYYLLEIPSEGGDVRIRLRSSDFDGYLALLDAELGFHLAENDDGEDGGPNALIEHSFDASNGHGFVLIEVSSAFAEDMGNYQLSVELVTRIPPSDPIGEILPLGTQSNVKGAAILDTDLLSGGALGHQYQVLGTTSLTRWAVVLESTQFDTWIGLSESLHGNIILENDVHDAGTLFFGTNRSRLDFFSGAGMDSLFLRVSSVFEDEVGEYDLLVDAQVLPLIQVGQSIEGKLSVTSMADPNFLAYGGEFYAEDYELEGVAVNIPLRVTISSETFLPECYLMEPPTQEPITWSLTDGKGGNQASFRFTPQPGLPYVLRATSVQENQTGDYRIIVQREDALSKLVE